VEITADTVIEDLVQLLPESVRVLSRQGLVCIQCGEPYWGTLQELAASRGVTDLSRILEELRGAALSRGEGGGGRVRVSP